MLFGALRFRPSVLHVSLFALVVGAAGCSGARDAGMPSGDESLKTASDAPGPLLPSELTGTLDREHLRATNPGIDDASFAVKWDAAQADALTFFRSFDAAYHADLADVPASRSPGGETLCAGDAHPENFGFMKLPSGTLFAINDFDDGGYCPAAFDAARFFTAVTLAYGDDDLTTQVLERYVDTLKDSSKAVTIDSSLAPDWKKNREKHLDKVTKDDAFVLGDSSGTDLSSPSADDRAAISSLVTSDARLSGAVVRDVADYDRGGGGSGGLRRSWVLVDQGDTRTILELKELADAGVTWGRHTQTLEPGERADTLKNAFWGDPDPNDMFDVDLFGKRFVVRDRLLRDAPDLGDLSSGDLAKVLEAEASELALLHTSSFSDVKKDDIRAWMSGTTATLAARWNDAWQAARNGL